MLYRTVSTALLGIGLLAGTESTANDYWLRASLGAWMSSLSGSFSYAENGGLAGSAEVDTLGLDDRETGLVLDGDVQIPFFLDVHVGGWTFATEGSAAISQDLVFGDLTFTAGDTLDTELKLTDVYAEVAWGLNADLVGFTIGLAGHLLNADATVTSQGTSASDNLSEGLPFPVLALRVHVNPFASLGLEAVLHGLALSYGDLEASFLDLRGQVVWRPIDTLGLMLGYRLVDLDLTLSVDDKEVGLDLSLGGPYVGLLAQF